MYDVGVCMTYTAWPTIKDSTGKYEWFSVELGRALYNRLSAEQKSKEEENKEERLEEGGIGYVVMSSERRGRERTEIRRYTEDGRVIYRTHGIQGGKDWFEHEETLPAACETLDIKYKNMKMHEEAVIARYKELDNGRMPVFMQATQHLDSLNAGKARLEVEKTRLDGEMARINNQLRALATEIQTATEKVRSFGSVAVPFNDSTTHP